MRTLALILFLTTNLTAGLKHDFDRPVFVYGRHPDLPISDFAKGRMGIPAPEHARIYLYAAYRYLSDAPFTPAEQRAYLRAWKARAPWGVEETGSGFGRNDWDDLRAKVLPQNSTGQNQTGTEFWTRGWTKQSICADDAFGNAASTLRKRIHQFGLHSPEVLFWVRGQDRVFASCNPKTAALPEAAPADLPALIRADRDYQIAAALLYSQRFEEALARFRSIAKDRSSPWRIWAPYLVGRTLLWQARVVKNDGAYSAKLDEAAAQFRAVLADRGLATTHDGAERLLDRCLLAAHPDAGLARLASRLLKPSAVGSRESDLRMYLDNADSLLRVTYGSGGKRIIPPDRVAQDDFSRWWETFQSTNPGSYSRAIQQWRKSGAVVWLYCAIWKAQADSPEMDALVAAALKIEIGSPAGAGLRYQAARLLAMQGKYEEARTQADLVLKALATLPSARNRVLDLRFQLAENLDEVARLVPRTVIMGSREMDAAELHSTVTLNNDSKTTPDPKLRELERRRAFTDAMNAAKLAAMQRLDTTGARVLSEKVPLELSRQLALKEDALPPNLAAELRLAVWTRSVLLRRFDVARELTPSLIREHPKVTAELRTFQTALDGAQAETAAAYVMLRLPGARPYMSEGYGRLAPAEIVDEWGRNWWYRLTPNEMYAVDLPYVGEEGDFGVVRLAHPFLLARLPFLTDDQRQQALDEWQKLRQRGERGLNWLALRIAADVQRHPERVNGAETLYRVFASAEWNRWTFNVPFELGRPGLESVYQLLSTRYANSIWFHKSGELLGARQYAKH